jgi:hypothetical protein
MAGEIIKTIREMDILKVCLVLADLFQTAMDITKMGDYLEDIFAVQPENKPQDPMGAGMLRAHVEEIFLCIDLAGLP